MHSSSPGASPARSSAATWTKCAPPPGSSSCCSQSTWDTYGVGGGPQVAVVALAAVREPGGLVGRRSFRLDRALNVIGRPWLVVALLLVMSTASAAVAAVSAASVTTAETIAKRVRMPMLLLELAGAERRPPYPRRCLDGASVGSRIVRDAAGPAGESRSSLTPNTDRRTDRRPSTPPASIAPAPLQRPPVRWFGNDRHRPPPAARQRLIDSRYAEPLDVTALARVAHALARPLQPRVPAGVRRDAPPVPADPTAGAGGGAAALDRPDGDGDLPRVGLTSVGSFTTSFGRALRHVADRLPGAYPPAAARATIPTCVLMAQARGRVRSRSTFSRSQPHATATSAGRRPPTQEVRHAQADAP